MSDDRKPWEREPGEPKQAFAAFVVYRSMLPEMRSVNAAYRAAKNVVDDPSKRAPGRWRLWSTEHSWESRADAHDAHLELIARKAAEKEHREHLREHLDRQRKVSAGLVSASLLALLKSQKRLESLKEADITPQMLPSLLRAAAALAEAGTNAEAKSLAVDQLLGVLNAPTSSD
jgi:hypothetical protein